MDDVYVDDIPLQPSSMVLFMEDWARIGAIPDWETKNKSFVRFAALLHNMGIKNHAFCLALHNQSLKGVDPFDPNLPIETRTMILLECRSNPWYVVREVSRVPAGSGGEPEPYEANRALICMIWLFFNHITNIQIQPRQTGKSLIADVIKMMVANFRARNTLINLFTKDETLRKENMERIKGMLEALPPWLCMRTKKDSDNSEFITINALGNKIVGHLPRSDPRNAEKVGRGFTSPIHFYDELPYQSWCEISYPASMFAMNAAIDRAKRNGSDFGVVVTTTAGKKDDRDGKFAYKLCVGACVWDERFYDCKDQKELERVIRKNSNDGSATIYSVFNHRQLGKSDAWLREKISNAKGTPDEAARDLLCKWTSGTGQSPFTPSQADAIRASERDVVFMDIRPEGYILRWYVSEQELDNYMNSSHFVLGIDTSDATGGDDIGFYLIDIRTMRVVCTAKINETNIISFAQWSADLLAKYKNITVIPERKSTGGTIIDYWLKILPTLGEDPFRRIFNLVVHHSDLDADRYEDIKYGSRRNPDTLIRYRKLFGYTTTGSGETSRNRLYSDALFLILKKLNGKFEDRDVINQLLGLEYRNGRIDHKQGSHDDMVVAMLLAYWLVLFGKNLSHYGIQVTDIMSELAGNEIDDLERMRNEEQKVLRRELNQLAEQYTHERDFIRLARIETKMRLIEKKIVMETDEINTVDQLIHKLREEKQKSRKQATIARPENPISIHQAPTGREYSSYQSLLRPRI